MFIPKKNFSAYDSTFKERDPNSKTSLSFFSAVDFSTFSKKYKELENPNSVNWLGHTVFEFSQGIGSILKVPLHFLSFLNLFAYMRTNLPVTFEIKMNACKIARDLEEAYGHFSGIANKIQGAYFVQEALFHKSQYDAQKERIEIGSEFYDLLKNPNLTQEDKQKLLESLYHLDHVQSQLFTENNGHDVLMTKDEWWNFLLNSKPSKFFSGNKSLIWESNSSIILCGLALTKKPIRDLPISLIKNFDPSELQNLKNELLQTKSMAQINPHVDVTNPKLSDIANLSFDQIMGLKDKFRDILYFIEPAQLAEIGKKYFLLENKSELLKENDLDLISQRIDSNCFSDALDVNDLVNLIDKKHLLKLNAYRFIRPELFDQINPDKLTPEFLELFFKGNISAQGESSSFDQKRRDFLAKLKDDLFKLIFHNLPPTAIGSAPFEKLKLIDLNEITSTEFEAIILYVDDKINQDFTKSLSGPQIQKYFSAFTEKYVNDEYGKLNDLRIQTYFNLEQIKQLDFTDKELYKGHLTSRLNELYWAMKQIEIDLWQSLTDFNLSDILKNNNSFLNIGYPTALENFPVNKIGELLAKKLLTADQLTDETISLLFSMAERHESKANLDGFQRARDLFALNFVTVDRIVSLVTKVHYSVLPSIPLNFFTANLVNKLFSSEHFYELIWKLIANNPERFNKWLELCNVDQKKKTLELLKTPENFEQFSTPLLKMIIAQNEVVSKTLAQREINKRKS